MILRKRLGASGGFTIVELLIVIVVIGILAAMTIVAYNGIQDKAKVASLQSDLVSAVKKLEAYKVQDGSELFPSSLGTVSVTPTADSTYNYLYVAADNSYCLTETNGATSYYVSSDLKNPTVGTCGADSLVGWWRFNGNANDSSTTGSNATLTGTTLTTGQSGASNGAYAFSGTGQYMLLGANGPLNQKNITMSTWVKSNVIGSVQTLMAKEYQYKFRITGTGLLQALIGGAGTAWTNTITTVSSTLSAGSWYHVVLTIDSNKSVAKIFVNGTTAGIFALAAPITVFNGNGLYAGTYTSAAGEALNGALDDARVYNRALSAAEVKGLYNAGAQ